MPRLPQVFAVSNGGHDFSTAEQFGPVTFLSIGAINKFQVCEMAREFSAILAFSSREDYLIPNGPTTMSCIACSIMAVLHGRLNLLLWKKGACTGEDKYERRILDLTQLLEGILR